MEISPFHAERIAQFPHMCIENHMTGRLYVSLWTLDAHVVYFHSYDDRLICKVTFTFAFSVNEPFARKHVAPQS